MTQLHGHLKRIIVGVLLSAHALTLTHASVVEAQSTNIAVSTFPEDGPALPGTTVQRKVRVTNRAPEELTVHVAHRGIQLLDDGKTQILQDDTSPWASSMEIDPADFTLPGMGARDVTLRLAVPTDVPPDDYLLAVGVTSVPAGGGGITAAVEIGALVSVNVPGDRVRSVAVIAHDLPSFVLGDHVTGRVRTRNTGAGLVTVWVDGAVRNAMTGEQVAQLGTRDRSQIAPATARDLEYTWASGITVGRFDVPVHVLYNQRDATTGEVDLDESVWVIHPAILLGLIVLVLAIGGTLWFRSRRTPGLPLAEPSEIQTPPLAV